MSSAAIFEAITAHVVADETEQQHQAAMLRLLARQQPFSRGTYEPGHFTASAFILDARGRLLLHHHRRLDRWLQMGGHIDAGETPLEAAVREAREESGLADVEPEGGILDLDVHWIPAGKGEPGHYHHDIRYLLRTTTPDLIAIEESESIELSWFDLDDAERLMASPESSRVIRKLRRLDR